MALKKPDAVSCFLLVVWGFFLHPSIHIFYPAFAYFFSWKSGQVLYLNKIDVF